MKKLALILILAALVAVFVSCDKDGAAEQTTAGQTTAGQTTAGQTTAGQTTAGQTTAEQTTAGQTTAEQTTAFNGIETDEDGNRWTPPY